MVFHLHFNMKEPSHPFGLLFAFNIDVQVIMRKCTVIMCSKVWKGLDWVNCSYIENINLIKRNIINSKVSFYQDYGLLKKTSSTLMSPIVEGLK